MRNHGGSAVHLQKDRGAVPRLSPITLFKLHYESGLTPAQLVSNSFLGTSLFVPSDNSVNVHVNQLRKLPWLRRSAFLSCPRLGMLGKIDTACCASLHSCASLLPTAPSSLWQPDPECIFFTREAFHDCMFLEAQTACCIAG